MNKQFFKFMPLMAAMIMATSCSKDDENNAPDNGRDDVHIVSTQIPFSIRVTNSNSLTKKMEYSKGEDGKISIAFAPDGTDTKLKVLYGTTELGNLDLVSDGADGYEFSGTLTLTEGVTAQSLSDGSIKLNYEYGTALEAPVSSKESLLDLVQNCGHLYKGSAKSNAEAITLTDQNTYLAISMSPFTDHDIKINGNEFTVEKQNDGRLWVAVPSGAAVESEELGLSKIGEEVLPSVCHKVARQYFTVADGKKVYFSPGNLQYNVGSAALTKWRFAPTQYDKCFEDGDHYSSGYIKENHAGWTGHEGWIDLFGWGTWTVNGTLAPNSTSKTTSDYETGVGNEAKDFNNTCKKEITDVLGTGWTTLSKDDWVALFARSNSYGHGKITLGEGDDNIIEGMILLPDTWTNPISGKTFTFNTSSWSNVYTVQEWEDMESSGAVFLPAAGSRWGTDVYIVGSDGRYWSSSALDEGDAYRLSFYSGRVYPGSTGDREDGYSVRLVRAL